jgi:hypothetical protein
MFLLNYDKYFQISFFHSSIFVEQLILQIEHWVDVVMK